MNCLLGSLGMAAFALQEKLTFDVFTAMKVPGYVEKAVYAMAMLVGVVCLFIPSKRRIVGIVLLAITVVLFGMSFFVAFLTDYSAGTLLDQAVFSAILSIVLLILGRKSA
jgi:hypothetical protein